MLLAALYTCVRLLLDLVLTGHNHDRDRTELIVLRHQLRVLQRQAKPVRWQPGDRVLLAALARHLPRLDWSAFLVKPDTLLRWHRELVRWKWASYARRPRRGRPQLAQECRELVLQLARENPTWGYLRIKGELRKLGYEAGATSIRRLLRRHNVAPAPKRSSLSWRTFLAAHAEAIVATDLFAVDTVFLKRLYVLFFIHLESRRLLFAACTPNPDSIWVTQQARNLTWQLAELGVRARFLIRDRDTRFAPAFDAVLKSEGAEIVPTPPRSPRSNSVAERWVGSARREAFDWLLVLGERHLRRVLKDYVEHYNLARPHRSLGLSPPIRVQPSGCRDGSVIRTSRLGGLLHEYSRAA